jgi:hypothetical protein
MGNIRNKKPMFIEKATLVAGKKTHKAMCFGSKGNNKMGKILSNGNQVKSFFFMVS